MTWDQWLKQASIRLNYIKNARYEAEILLTKVTGASKSKIFSFSETQLHIYQYLQLEKLLTRREYGEPIAYLIGEWDFWSFSLEISNKTIIPRQDTECLVEHALYISTLSKIEVLDLGTGTGAIALALALERPNWSVTGIDNQLELINLANKNAAKLRLSNIQFLYGDWFKFLQKKNYDLIVSNPPYIDINDKCLIQGDVRFEPKRALVAANKGLADLTWICRNARMYLKLGGWLILEHGWKQGKLVRTLFINFGFNNIVTIRDYNGNERVSLGQWNK